MTPLRQRLWNPPNAVEDTGINLRNGRPVRQPPKLEVVSRGPEIISGQAPPLTSDSPYPVRKRTLNQLYLELPAHKVRDIILRVCAVWNVFPSEVLSKRRGSHLIEPRHTAIAIAYRLTSLSTTQLCRHFKMSDHTSIMHANRKMADHVRALNLTLPATASIADWVEGMKAALDEKKSLRGAP